MNKFTNQDLATIKTGKTEFKKLVNQIAKNSIFKSPTISFFNKKGNLAVIKSFDYQLQDLGNLIKAYRYEFKELMNKYADNEFSARSTLSAARPGTKPVRRTTKKPKLAERKNVVTFPDGFEFKKVSPAYAKKNYKTQMIYGLEPVKGIEGLIDNIDDFHYWQSATNIFGKEY
jgi:hypothetical protein